MRRLEGRDLSLGTVTERNAPESVTPIRSRPATATCSVDSRGPALDQVGLRCRKAGTSAHLLIARVESEAGESQAKTCTVIPGRALRANPESRNSHPCPGREAARRSSRRDASQNLDRNRRWRPRRSRLCGAPLRKNCALHRVRDTVKAHCVLATRGGIAWVTNWVASRMPMPSGVGIIMRNGTRMRVPAIGANQASMLRCAARYLIAARSGM
jgi:hypothetical protein